MDDTSCLKTEADKRFVSVCMQHAGKRERASKREKERDRETQPNTNAKTVGPIIVCVCIKSSISPIMYTLIVYSDNIKHC